MIPSCDFQAATGIIPQDDVVVVARLLQIQIATVIREREERKKQQETAAAVAAVSIAQAQGEATGESCLPVPGPLPVEQQHQSGELNSLHFLPSPSYMRNIHLLPIWVHIVSHILFLIMWDEIR